MPALSIPERVTVCGIGYRVQESADKCIVFTEDQPTWGQQQRVMLSKDDSGIGCWYVEHSLPRIMGSHVVEMLRLASMWRGPNHTRWQALAK